MDVRRVNSDVNCDNCWLIRQICLGKYLREREYKLCILVIIIKLIINIDYFDIENIFCGGIVKRFRIFFIGFKFWLVKSILLKRIKIVNRRKF